MFGVRGKIDRINVGSLVLFVVSVFAVCVAHCAKSSVRQLRAGSIRYGAHGEVAAGQHEAGDIR